MPSENSEKNNKIFTFGCRLNSFESEVIRGNIEQSGCDNIAVFNTCAVTKEAERQAKQSIRKFHRENPESKIIVTGCAAQINPKSYLEINGVDQVLGNDEKLKAESFINLQENHEKLQVNDIMQVTQTAPQLVSGLEGRARAFMQVQNGCDHRCTFCIIPYGRGNNRSVTVAEIVKQAQALVNQGYNEIVLTGVDVTSYGADLPNKPSLGEMVRRMLKLVPELKRLRFSSIDVAEIDDVLFDLFCHDQRIMPHLHLSLQSGDDMILKRMKRRHTRNDVIKFCDKLAQKRPDIVFGADIIAGFPTETEQMFQNSLQLVREVGIAHLHVFPYSKRQGTPAAKIPDSKQVPVSVRKERAAILRKEGAIQLDKILQNTIGTKQEIIIEKNNMGRTAQYLSVDIVSKDISTKNTEHNSPKYQTGDVMEVTIIGANDGKLLGKTVF